MRKVNFTQDALNALRPEYRNWFKWADLSAGETWENAIVIQDGVTKPTKAEFDAKVAELQAAYDEANAPYKLSRAEEYPPLAEQLDYIYHNGVEAWKTDIIDPIKAKYPKPE